MIQIPNLPPKDELEYKKKEFLVSLNDQMAASSRTLIFVLFAVIIVSLPLYFVLRSQLTQQFIASYKPPEITNATFDAKPLEVLKAESLPVTAGVFSASAQVFNPNTDFSARTFDYEFVFSDNNGKVLKSVPAASFLLAGKTRRVMIASVRISVQPSRVSLQIKDTRWTNVVPKFEPNLTVLQKRSGNTAEGNFYVEGLLRNNHSFQIKSVALEAAVFDSKNQNVAAVNSTQVGEMQPFESRYFRMVWPVGQERLFDQGQIGQIEINPSLNPFIHGLDLGGSEA